MWNNGKVSRSQKECTRRWYSGGNKKLSEKSRSGPSHQQRHRWRTTIPRANADLHVNNAEGSEVMDGERVWATMSRRV